MTALTPERVLSRLEWRVLRRLDGRLQGEHRTAFRGTGTDVTDLREYQPGDDLRRIDWNVTARVDETYVREYAEDREVTAWLLLDCSPSMAFGSAGRTKDVVMAEIAATVAQLLSRGGSRVGAVLFDAGVLRTIPPGTGRKQVLSILAQLMQDRQPASAGTTDLAAALRAAAGIARRRSVVVLVSDLIAEPGWERPLAQLARRHDVLVLQVLDPTEFDLPPVGLVWVEDAETGEQLLVDTDDAGFQRRLRELADERQASLGAAAASAGTRLFPVSTDEDLLRALFRVAEMRRRQR